MRRLVHTGDSRDKPGWPKPLGLLLLVSLLGLATWAPIRSGELRVVPIDDAHITMLYARSLANGEGFRPHPNAEPSLGTTSPLHTFLLAGLFRVSSDGSEQRLTIWLAVGFWIATGWLWFLGAPAFGLTRLQGFASAALVMAEVQLALGPLGLETWQFCFLLTLSTLMYVQNRYSSAGLLAGLLCLTRPEGIVLLALFGADLVLRAIREGRHKFYPGMVRLLFGFGFVAVTWVSYAWVQIGTLIPSTIAAKHAQDIWQLPFIKGFAHSVFLHWTSLPRIPTPLEVGSAQAHLPLWIPLALGGLYWAVRRRVIAINLLVTWGVLVLILYTFAGAPWYPWYAIPLIYLTTVLAGIGLTSISRLLIPGTSGRLDLARNALAVLLVVFVATLATHRGMIDAPSPPAAVLDYQRLAQWINENTEPSDRVAYIEVGSLQWHSKRRIVDLLGLISPEVIPLIRDGDFGRAVEVTRPEYLVMALPFWNILGSVARHEGFREDYVLESALLARKRFHLPRPLYIYRRDPEAARKSDTLPTQPSRLGPLWTSTPAARRTRSGLQWPANLYQGLPLRAETTRLEDGPLRTRKGGRLVIRARVPVDRSFVLFGWSRTRGDSRFQEKRRFFIPLARDGRPHTYSFPAALLSPERPSAITGLRFEFHADSQEPLLAEERIKLLSVQWETPDGTVIDL